MPTARELSAQIMNGQWDSALRKLYGAAFEAQRGRYAAALEGFMQTFGTQREVRIYSAPGRTEIGGTHTDHNHGIVMAAAVDLDIIAVAASSEGSIIRVSSKGFPEMDEVDTAALSPRAGEAGRSAALVRGMAAGIVKAGGKVGGVDIYTVSSVLRGSGLSSSAAFEVVLGAVLNGECNEGSFSAVKIAQISQYAENVFFGKPSGLMDQMGSSVGGAVAIDFADPAAPVVKKVEYDFTRSGHALCIVDTGSCHADLTDDYADITREMGAVAAHFGKKFLRDVDEGAFRAALPQLRQECGDRAVLRTMHFFEEDCRAEQEAQALEQGDFAAFLALVDQSGLSSALNLQNTWSAAAPQQQAIPVALAVGRELLGGSGAIRVHGGGFAGTIQAFVPNEKLETFQQGMEELLGPGMCHILHIRPQGGCVVLK